MLEQYKSLMELLGYDVNKKGLYLFVCLAEEIRELLKNGKTHEEVINMLPSIMLEEYRFAFEMRKSSYMELLNDFNNNNIIEDINTLDQVDYSIVLNNEQNKFNNITINYKSTVQNTNPCENKQQEFNSSMISINNNSNINM